MSLRIVALARRASSYLAATYKPRRPASSEDSGQEAAERGTRLFVHKAVQCYDISLSASILRLARARTLQDSTFQAEFRLSRAFNVSIELGIASVMVRHLKHLCRNGGGESRIRGCDEEVVLLSAKGGMKTHVRRAAASERNQHLLLTCKDRQTALTHSGKRRAPEAELPTSLPRDRHM